VNVPNQLIEFSVQSVTAGIDAIGEVTIRLRYQEQIFPVMRLTQISSRQAKHMNALNRLYAVLQEGAREQVTQKFETQVVYAEGTQSKKNSALPLRFPCAPSAFK